MLSEVDLVLSEIRRCYQELDKFWAEEIFRAIETLKMRRVDPTDVKRWKNFSEDLKQTIESWNLNLKVQCSTLLRVLRYALPTKQNTLFRMSYQVVMLKLYAAAMDAHLRFAHSCFRSGIPLD